MHGKAQAHDVGIEITELQRRGILWKRRDVHTEEIDSEFTIDVMELVATLSVRIFQVLRIDFAEVMQVE